MATRNFTVADVYDTASGFGAVVGKVFTWTGVLNGDVGLPIPSTYAAFVDRSFQFEGTFGAGGSATVEGSNNDDGTGGVGNYRALTTPQSTSVIAITAGGIAQVTEATQNMRPHVTAGDGTTNLTVTAYCTRHARRDVAP